MTTPPTILVADDDLDILALVSYRLAAAGHEVITAEHGEEALAKLRRFRPDFAVLDVLMPGLTGLEVLAHMRKEEPIARIPVLLLTARVADGDAARGYSAGADDYLGKPFSPKELHARVARLLQRGRLPEVTVAGRGGRATSAA